MKELNQIVEDLVNNNLKQHQELKKLKALIDEIYPNQGKSLLTPVQVIGRTSPVIPLLEPDFEAHAAITQGN